MSDRTGRPKEEGGHHRIDMSVDGRTLRILDVLSNRSKYVEHCVEAYTVTYWIGFQKLGKTFNDNHGTFKTAATFYWVPQDCANNTIVAVYCTFEQQRVGRGFRFKLKVNDAETSSSWIQGSSVWPISQVYTDWSFTQGLEIVPNQNLYVIEIQFEPEGASDCVYIGNVCMFLEVLDGLPSLEP